MGPSVISLSTSNQHFVKISHSLHISQNAIQLRQVHPRCQQGNNTPAAPKLPEHTQEQLNAVVFAQKLNLLRIPQVSKKKRVSAANDENVTFNRSVAVRPTREWMG